LFLLQLARNILATQPRVTRFKIDWDDKANTSANATENSQSAECATIDNSMDNSMDADEAPRLIHGHNNGNGNMNEYSKLERMSAESTSSLMEPPDVSLIAPGISNCTDNSMTSPMEVMF